MNLPELKKIAEAATPGLWRVEDHRTEGNALPWRSSGHIWAPDENGFETPGKSIAQVSVKDVRDDDGSCVEFEANAKHIATFNPQTVLRLIETLEVYEKALKAECWSADYNDLCTSCEALDEGAKILRGEEK